jgi:Icc protein
VLLAQLSDTHLLADPAAPLRGHNTTTSLVAVLDALPPRVDVMVLTGDIAEDGAPEAYRRAMALTDGRAEQCHFVAGNHDDPATLRSVVGPMGPLRIVPLSEHWTLVLVDSYWVGHDAGRIGSDTLTALCDELAETRNHVAVCLHHPPISPCPNVACGLTDSDEFLEVVRGGPVRLVLSGHVHEQFDTTVDGTRFLGAPSTFRQLRHGGDPHYQDSGEPPAALLVELLDNGDVTPHLVTAS